MRFAAIVVSAVLVGEATLPLAVGQTPSSVITGTISRIVPQQGIVIKTNDGRELNVPITPTNRLEVFTRVDVNDVPDGTPCLAMGGQIAAGGKQMSVFEIRIPTAGWNNFNGSTIILNPNGTLDFVAGTMGRLRKGSPPGFQVGQARYRLRNQAGQVVDAPTAQQNVLLNQVIPLTGRGQNSTVRVEYELGADLQMAGTNARVTVLGADVTRALIRIERTEPLPVPDPKKK